MRAAAGHAVGRRVFISYGDDGNIRIESERLAERELFSVGSPVKMMDGNRQIRPDYFISTQLGFSCHVVGDFLETAVFIQRDRCV